MSCWIVLLLFFGCTRGNRNYNNEYYNGSSAYNRQKNRMHDRRENPAFLDMNDRHSHHEKEDELDFASHSKTYPLIGRTEECCKCENPS